MKIIIPMSGLGKRFKDVGYQPRKPLIKVDGKPIIEYVISMFPKGSDFIFICNNDHLKDESVVRTLNTLAPGGIILGIDPHDKGPVFATTLAHAYIQDDEEVIVSYCDYYMKLDINDMLKKVRENGYDGAVPSYTGFHPHLLHKKVYGGVLVDQDNIMQEYREKYSFTEDPMLSHHSAGMYYFKSGGEFKKYSDELLDSDLRINGEAYTSMVYYLYLRDGKKIYVPEPTHFMQWGTPEDLEEYEAWSNYFHTLFEQKKSVTDVPQERFHLVKVPHLKESSEFEKCYTYWETYFLSIFKPPYGNN